MYFFTDTPKHDDSAVIGDGNKHMSDITVTPGKVLSPPSTKKEVYEKMKAPADIKTVCHTICQAICDSLLCQIRTTL